MPLTLYLFPDTNLFFQCKALDQLEWTRFGADRVELIVTRPIIAEIDSHKGKGNSRLAKRARGASSIIGAALVAESGFLRVNHATCDVRLYVKATLKEDPALDEKLAYTERDHQLVGIASRFANENPETDVRVLTHDNGVLAAASGVGLKFERVPEDWLLEPETDERDKQLSALQQQLKKYQDAEPIIEIDLESPAHTGRLIEVESPLYLPLAEDEIARLLDRLQAEIPVETDFGPTEGNGVSPTSGLQSWLMARKVFKPSTEEDVENYCAVLYPEWLKRCETVFRSLADELNAQKSWPLISLHLRNSGARPAQDVLVSFECEGKFLLAVPSVDNDEDEAGEECDPIRLPPPPAAPKGVWEEQPHPLNDLRSSIERAQRLQFLGLPAQPRYWDMPEISKVKQNAFYYDGGRPKQPVVQIALTCQQLRHQIHVERFWFELRWSENDAPVQAALRVNVHAANMTDIVTRHFRMHMKTRAESVFEDADALIDLLKTKH